MPPLRDSFEMVERVPDAGNAASRREEPLRQYPSNAPSIASMMSAAARR